MSTLSKHTKDTDRRVDLAPSAFNSDIPPTKGKRREPLLPDNSHMAIDGPRRDWLLSLLSSHNIDTDRSQWKIRFDAYFDDRQHIWPFLHPPQVHRTFDWLWTNDLRWTFQELQDVGESKSSIAILFVCMALGECATKPRLDSSGYDIPGINLYIAGTSLLQNLLNLNPTPPQASLIDLQALLIAISYLCHVSLYERAGPVLAQAIAIAYTLGVHQDRHLQDLPVFEAEMTRRTWWCLYIYDRMYSVEIGNPYMILERVCDVGLPQELTVDFLEDCRLHRRMPHLVEYNMDLDASPKPPTLTPYLKALVVIATLTGHVRYSTNEAGMHTSRPDTRTKALETYVEMALGHMQKSLPSWLVWQENVPWDERFEDVEWWQMKQCLCLLGFSSVIRILVHKQSATGESPATIEADAQCGRWALLIVDAFDSVPDHYPKHRYPMSWALTASAMVLLDLASRYPSLQSTYRRPAQSVLRSLHTWCRRVWVSERSIRAIARLDEIATRIWPLSVSPTPSTAANEDLARSIPKTGGIILQDISNKVFGITITDTESRKPSASTGGRGSENSPVQSDLGRADLGDLCNDDSDLIHVQGGFDHRRQVQPETEDQSEVNFTAWTREKMGFENSISD